MGIEGPILNCGSCLRWAPQLGQRSWQACMSIIVCPHMGHSFFLPTAIHHAPGSASYYSFWQTRRLRPSGSCAPAPRSPPVCLDSRCTLATAHKSSGAKTCTKRKPLTFVHVDENDPQVEQCKSERGEGSKISRICWVDSDRPALDSRRQKNTEPPAQA